MGRIAKKKKIVNEAGYVVVPIAMSDIEKQEDFGTFTITRTKYCIAYTNHVGYTVITKPYTTTPEAKGTNLSLYTWLNYVLDTKDYLDAHKDEKYENSDITNGQFLEVLKVVTEANITKPCVVFTNIDYAMEEANKHIVWLDNMAKELQYAMSKTPHEEDVKANEEAFGEAIASENLVSIIKEENIKKE